MTFFCPACGIKLTVPASLAGVSGPCPSCGSQIQAPLLATAPLQTSVAPPYPPQAATTAPPPPNPVAAPVQAAPVQAASVQAAPVPANPPALKPEPRQLPNRPHPVELVARQMPEPNPAAGGSKLQAAPLPRHPHKPSFLSRFLLMLLFLIATVALVFGILTVLKSQTAKTPSPVKVAPPAGPPPAGTVPEAPKPAPAPVEEPVKPPSRSALPTPAPEQPKNCSISSKLGSATAR